MGRLRGLIGNTLAYKSLPSEFESQRGHIERVLQICLRFIAFGGRSDHLAYHVHKGDRKKSNVTILIF